MPHYSDTAVRLPLTALRDRKRTDFTITMVKNRGGTFDVRLQHDWTVNPNDCSPRGDTPPTRYDILMDDLDTFAEAP